MKKVFRFIIIAFLALIVILVAKTIMLDSKQLSAEKGTEITVMDGFESRLSGAVQIPTITWEDTQKTDTAQFTVFHNYLKEVFPLIHDKLPLQKFNHHALLYTWEGKNLQLKPVILLAHQDVVPADSVKWEKSPFSGLNDGTYIWGRGTLDDKGSLMSIMEAVEHLLAENYQPERTIMMAFGNDEEVGEKGAQAIATYLESQNIEAEFIIDEGMVITKGLVPMMDKPVALIGTSEKGYLTLELSCQVDGGHSSTPRSETAISILSSAISKITQNRPDPKISEPVSDFLEYLGPETSWPVRIVFANQWLFKPIILNIYTGSYAGNALVRTTTAPTKFNAGFKDNVMPVQASATINHRLLPGEDTGKLVHFLNEVVSDERVKITKAKNFRNAATVSPVDCPAFEIIHKTIKSQYENTLVMPTLMLGASDSRHYTGVSKNIYRFAPYVVTNEDLDRIHGLNERIEIKDYKKMIGFYYQLIMSSASEAELKK